MKVANLVALGTVASVESGHYTGIYRELCVYIAHICESKLLINQHQPLSITSIFIDVSTLFHNTYFIFGYNLQL